MNDARLRELYAAPELAHLPTLLVALDALLVSLRVQHPTFDNEWTANDPATLLEARALVEVLVNARRQLVAYRKAVRRSLRQPYCERDDFPF